MKSKRTQKRPIILYIFTENTREELTTSRELNDKLQNDVINLNDKVNEIQRKSKEVMMGLQKQILEKDNVLVYNV